MGSDLEPVTPALLADLQAGLLDDETAAAVRRRVRADPDAARTLAALDTVRRHLGRLGADLERDTASPEAPAEVTARIGAALRDAGPPPKRR
ncbi:hypothetical protein GR927_13435 [Mycolicibacterium sp. 3033]|nr:hypothetical protein [Mycolicibacterium aurantiacum]